mgnify:CR=1 FL=1
MNKLLLPFEWKSLAGKSENVVGNWKHEGVIFPFTEPWGDEFSSFFPSSRIETGDSVRYYYSLCSITKPEREVAWLALAVREGDTFRKYRLSDNPADYFSLTGLPEDCRPIQPVVLRLAENDWRMYFWIHGPGKCRFLMASSTNGLNWQVSGIPLLYHYPNDPEAASRPLQSSNDATTVYQREDRTFEIYSAAKTFVQPDSPHYFEKDHAGGCIRIIQRWTSRDGLNLSEPDVILTPDGLDPPDLQFYYLSCLDAGNYRFGFVGRYRIDAQRMDLELVYSVDGLHWERPFRDSCFPLQFPEEAFGVYAAASIYLEGSTVCMPYTATNTAHNAEACSEERSIRRICLATIPLHQLFGRQMTNGALLSPPVRTLARSQTFHFRAGDRLRLSVMNAFGEKELMSREITADSTGRYQLEYPDDLFNKVVRFKLDGDFTLFTQEM